MFKILIAEPTHDSMFEKLQKAGFHCDYKPYKSVNELIKIIKNYQGLVIRSKYKIDENFINSGKNLKFIARAGSGMENIDTKYAETQNILCINSPEGNRDSVAEHALGMLLNLLNKINIAGNKVKSGIWDRKNNIGNELDGKTIGIIGYGNTGKAFAKRLKSFNVNVIAYDKYKKNYSDNYAKEENMNTIFKQTDILSLHIPLTSETNYMINNEFINKLKKPVYLINTSRGKVVKTVDLVKNIKSGKIKGACLDVLEYEKTSFENILTTSESEIFNFIVEAENVIITPHIAGSTKESFIKISKILADKIIKQFQSNKI